MEQPLDPMNDEYIDILKTESECDFPAYVKVKAQEVITRLKEEGTSKILEEYYRLATLPELSPDDAEEDLARLDEILTLAEQDELLLFLIGEIDHILDARMGLLSSDLQKYERQKAWLAEHLVVSPPDTDLHRMLQLRLRELGLYEGPIDGVFGKRSRSAVKAIQQSHSMPVDGIPNPQTMSIILEKTGASYE